MVTTFLIGALCLTVWLYLTDADATAIRILWTCLLYMLAAEMVGAILSITVDLAFPLNEWTLLGVNIVLLAPVFEELAKVLACRSLRAPLHRFALVFLFGIYELMLSKPFTMEKPFSMHGFFESLEAVPALGVHGLTAVIYAFYFTGANWRQLTIGVAVHCANNALAFFAGVQAAQIYAAACAVAILALFPWTDEAKRGRWA
jgi:hypothetical protein